MAISSFGRGKRGDETTDSADVKSGGGNLTAFIDQGSDFDGKLTFKDTVRIDGSFQGEISSENTLIVGVGVDCGHQPVLNAEGVV